jgi:hypothetical protein
MSAFGGILDALLADVTTAVAGVTTSRRVVPLQMIAQSPYAYAYMREMTASLLDYGQEAVAYTAVVVLVCNELTQEQVYAHVDAIRTQVYADRTLAGTCDIAYLSAVETFEEPMPATRKGAALTFTVRQDR